jgi:hypothetical protein
MLNLVMLSEFDMLYLVGLTLPKESIPWPGREIVPGDPMFLSKFLELILSAGHGLSRRPLWLMHVSNGVLKYPQKLLRRPVLTTPFPYSRNRLASVLTQP